MSRRLTLPRSIRLVLVGFLSTVLALGASLTVASGAQAVSVQRNGTPGCTTAQAQDAGAGQKVAKKAKKAKKAVKKSKQAVKKAATAKNKAALKKAKAKKTKSKKQLRKAQSRKAATARNAAVLCAPITATPVPPTSPGSTPAPGTTGPLAPLCAQIPELAPVCDAASQLPGTSPLQPLCDAAAPLNALCDATDTAALEELVALLAEDPSLVGVLVDAVTQLVAANPNGAITALEELPQELEDLITGLVGVLEGLLGDIFPRAA